MIDQHAACEKTTYESLLHSSVSSQQLMPPFCVLSLDLADQKSLEQHKSLLGRLGFKVTPEHLLTAVGSIAGCLFNAGDLYQFLGYLQDHPNTTDVHPVLASNRRLTGMLASKACRSSIMIGDSLSRE